MTDYITYAGHNNFTTAVMANKDFFDGLPEEDQKVIQDAINVGLRLHRRLSEGPGGK